MTDKICVVPTDLSVSLTSTLSPGELSTESCVRVGGQQGDGGKRERARERARRRPPSERGCGRGGGRSQCRPRGTRDVRRGAR